MRRLVVVVLLALSASARSSGSLRTLFVKRDRIGDAFKSFEKLRSLAAAPGR